ncbi:MAG: ribbon-helix-helix domain-containing protein [Pseudomonadota bacterium]
MLRKHSITIRGHQTSFSIEDEFWDELRAISQKTDIPVSRLVTQIDTSRLQTTNLSSAIRLYVLRELRHKD